MNKALQNVLFYHQETKHSQQRYARSLGYMDWATQPDAFRNYEPTKKIMLPLSENNPMPPYSLLDASLPNAPLLKESLSQLLQFSLGIAAWKVSGGSSWAVRCNASSGNLHPTESYVVLPPVFQEQNNKSTIFHYAPKNHALEILAEFETSFWEHLEKGSFLLGLSSIVWREVWKYGERAFRYTQLDVGHAWQALVVSAKLLGWKITKLDTIAHSDMTKIMGLDQKQRFFENEIADMLLLVSPTQTETKLSLDILLQDLPKSYQGQANKLSHSMQDWKIIDTIEQATSQDHQAQTKVEKCKVSRKPSANAKDIILNRRSIHVMDKEQSFITQEQFHILLQSVAGSLDGNENATHLVLFVHRVQTYEQGLYLLLRNEKEKELLKGLMHSTFTWENTPFKHLYILEKNNFQLQSKIISCNQAIASDGAFSLGMLCNYTQELHDYGAQRYKELYWECGAIGQQLYLEATSLGLSGTGIGCFLDDMMHDILGLSSKHFQILYHFTVGRGYVDSRIQTRPAYSKPRVV